jgi:hypothetical protein
VVVLIQNGGGTSGGAHAGTVTVVVFDEQDDSRIADATVILDDGTSTTDQNTDTLGVTVFTGVALGTYNIHVVKAGFGNISLYGLEAPLVVLPLGSPRLRVQGSVLGGSASGTTYNVEFATLEDSPLAGATPDPEYGEVITYPTGGNPAYEVEIDKGQTDTLTFTETDNSTGRIINRKTLVIGPYTADQTGVNVTFDNTTGLHEITGTISNLNTNIMGATFTVAYRDGKKFYEAFGVTGAGGSRTYSLQLPPNRAVMLQLLTYVGPVDVTSPPEEAQEFPATTGAPDNTPVTVNLSYDMVTVQGNFSNDGGAFLYVMAPKYGNLQPLTVGLVMMGYSMRVPTNVATQNAVSTYTGMLTGMTRGAELAFGPFSGDTTNDLDLGNAVQSLLQITTNLPANVANHDPATALYGTYANYDLAWPPFMAMGTVGASDITFNLDHFPRANVTYFLMVVDDDLGTNAGSQYFRGNLTDPPNDLGTTQNITLLDVPGVTSPPDGGNTTAQVTFTWNGDAFLTGKGFRVVDIEDPITGDTVWTVVVEASIASVQLPTLPAAVAGLSLQSGTTYDWRVNAMAFQNFDFNNFQIDSVSSITRILSGQDSWMAGTDDFTFSVN